MSLLDKRAEAVTVYPQIEYLDDDGNTHEAASEVGIPWTAVIQPQGQSGTAARRAEQDNEGYESETIVRCRLTRGFEEQYGRLGRASVIEWDGKPWTVFGDPWIYRGSPRTAHVDYTLKRG